MAESETRVSRDTRLLILVIAVAVVVLFVLAQFRFPQAEVLSTVSPAGLDRLAAQSNYDDLANAVQTTLLGVEPSLVVLDVDGVPDGSKQTEHRRTLAIRLRDGLVIGPLPANFKIADPSGPVDGPLIKVTQPARGLLMAELTTETSPARSASLAGDFPGYAYVAVVELAKGGPTASPMFIGRVDAQSDPRWTGNLLAPGGSATLPVGSFVFLLDGRFVGLVVNVPNGPPAIAPAALLTVSFEPTGGSGTEVQR